MLPLALASLALCAPLKVCPLCGRDIPPELESRHHLVPKLKGGKTRADNIVVLHRPCHDKVHACFTETELARSYATIEALRADPAIDKFARWIAKRPIGFRDGTTSLRRRRQRGARMVEGLDAESDSVGPGIYGGRVERTAAGEVVIGQQYEAHNSLPGPVYAGGGYAEMSEAIRAGPDAVRALLAARPELADEVSTGGATPLHVCGMSRAGQHSTRLLAEARAAMGCDVDARDTWGYTALQRHASNDLAVGAQALLEAGASHTARSGLVEGQGDSARELALRLRSFAVLRLFQQYELWLGLELPEGEIEL
jgi:hypothetical protein